MLGETKVHGTLEERGRQLLVASSSRRTDLWTQEALVADAALPWLLGAAVGAVQGLERAQVFVVRLELFHDVLADVAVVFFDSSGSLGEVFRGNRFWRHEQLHNVSSHNSRQTHTRRI